MSFFDDDPFDEIVREFFGKSGLRERRKQVIQGEEEDRNIDFIEEGDYFYLIFELPGYDKQDISVLVDKNEIEIQMKKKNGEKMQTYLARKLRQGESIKKNLPKFVNAKKFDYTMKNGVLEIKFKK